MITVDNMPREMRKGRTGWNKMVTHCRQGHEYTEENTLDKDCGRGCRECARLASRKWYYEQGGREYQAAYRKQKRERQRAEEEAWKARSS